MMRDGDIVEMDVGESLGWVGMAGIDADMRLLCGLRPVTEAQHAGLYLRQVQCRDRGQAGDLQRRLWRRAYRRLQEALGHSVTASAPRAAPAPGASSIDALVVENLSKRFGGALALNGVSLRVRRGEVHGLLGSQRLGQIDADQNPCRLPCARARRADASVRRPTCRSRSPGDNAQGARPRLRASESRR